jgi:hypothetical protein
MRKKRTRQPQRFQVGDPVVIRDIIATLHVGGIGIVAAVYRHRQSHTLDKYDVEFDDGLLVTVWDIQLSHNGAELSTGISKPD